MTNKVLDIFSPFKTKDIFEDLEKEMFGMNPLFSPFGTLTTRDNVFSRYDKMLERSGTLAIDLKEKDNSYHIVADLPGFTEEEIDLRIENNILSIIAEKSHSEKDEGNDSSILSERYSHKRIERRINLGSRSINIDEIVASLANGTLEITVPFSEESLPKKISISVNGDDNKEIESEKKEE